MIKIEKKGDKMLIYVEWKDNYYNISYKYMVLDSQMNIVDSGNISTQRTLKESLEQIWWEINE